MKYFSGMVNSASTTENWSQQLRSRDINNLVLQQDVDKKSGEGAEIQWTQIQMQDGDRLPDEFLSYDNVDACLQ